MANESSTTRQSALRAIPSVNDIVDAPQLTDWRERLPRSMVVEAVRVVIDDYRAAIAANRADSTLAVSQLAERAAEHLKRGQQPPLRSVINATGIILHTGLGRAPLSDEATHALADVAKHYAPVEIDLASGERNARADLVRGLLCELTGAESATVVNNNAAALMIILSTIARDRSVIVSRGELIEIGGSFRLPDVMEAGGAILREVGTTNKTRLSDYERAIDDETAALMKVHTSNYRIEGFTESPGVAALVELAHDHELPFVHDIGSGVMQPMGEYGLGDEPDARTSIEAGADLVLFSGDKLLGGPQAGVMVGRGDLIARIEKNAMMRAMRLDKLILAALAATLQLHRDPALAVARVPVLAMLNAPLGGLRARAQQLAEELAVIDGLERAEVVETQAYLGGGALPAEAIESVAVAVGPRTMSEQELAGFLRLGSPAIVARTRGGAVLFDLRTIFPEQDEAIVDALRAALASSD